MYNSEVSGIDTANSKLDSIIKKYEEEMLNTESKKKIKEYKQLIRAAYMAKDVMNALRGNK